MRKYILFLTFVIALVIPSFVLSDFLASKKSNKYHLSTCKWAKKIKSKNLIIFKTSSDAENSGYVPCRVCILFSARDDNNSKENLPKDNFYFCYRVVDGDTILVRKGNIYEKVRLIGVDTPETVHPLQEVEYFGKEASLFTRNMVEGKRIRLEYDWQKRDKYNRLLAYVFLEDGTFLNAEIIKQGYGFAYTKYPFKYLDEFRRYEKEARENERGLWGIR